MPTAPKLKEPKTKVVFRKWKKGFPPTNYGKGVIIAIFPEVGTSNEHPGESESYEHIGQHGGADIQHVIRNTALAKPREYADLKKELQERGYRLDVKKKITRAMDEARFKTIGWGQR